MNTSIWIGIYSNIINGLTYAIGSIAVLVMLSRPDIGHRFMLRLLAAFSLLRMVVCFTVAWDAYYHQISRTTSIFRLVSSLVGVMLFVNALLRWKDLVRTITESEHLDRLRTDERADSEQARMNQKFLSAQTLKRSRDLIMPNPIR